MDAIIAELKSLEKKGLYRTLRTVSSDQDTTVIIKNKKYLSFCSNNYLGLANNLDVKEAAIKAVQRFGCGTGASRLISGNMEIHLELEKRIARFKKTEAAILYPTGYMANIGVITALAGKNDLVIIDKLNHASIIDGCRQSGATIRVYPHKNALRLEKILKSCVNFPRRLIITDSVFSMDGDIAPLPEIIGLAEKYNALLMIDEAHATGVVGDGGRGVGELFKLFDKIDIVMGTLSKAIGSIGGFVAGKSSLIEYLRNHSRSFIYTTALPPSVCAASIAALDIIERDEGLRSRLWDNINFLKSGLKRLGFKIPEAESAIIPVVIGDPEDTLAMSNYLFDNGILIPAIRPPTIPKNSSRLRITVMATHTKEQIERLLEVLIKTKKKICI